jgi:hypothetical protein
MMMVRMTISCLNEDLHWDYSIWGFEDGKIFSMKIKEKVHPKEVWDGEEILYPVRRRLHSPKVY